MIHHKCGVRGLEITGISHPARHHSECPVCRGQWCRYLVRLVVPAIAADSVVRLGGSTYRTAVATRRSTAIVPGLWQRSLCCAKSGRGTRLRGRKSPRGKRDHAEHKKAIPGENKSESTSLAAWRTTFNVSLLAVPSFEYDLRDRNPGYHGQTWYEVLHVILTLSGNIDFVVRTAVCAESFHVVRPQPVAPRQDIPTRVTPIGLHEGHPERSGGRPSNAT